MELGEPVSDRYRKPYGFGASGWAGLGYVAGAGAQGEVQRKQVWRFSGSLVELSMVLGLCGRHDDRLGSTSDRYSSVGNGCRVSQAGQRNRREAIPDG